MDPNDRLKRAGVLLLVALLVHGADHFARGLDSSRTAVVAAGTVQFLVAVLAVVLAFRGHPSAPGLAMVIGFAGAAGFSSAHLLPEWGALSDAYVGTPVAPGVTWFSWVTAVVEIGADLNMGFAGLLAHRSVLAREAS